MRSGDASTTDTAGDARRTVDVDDDPDALRDELVRRERERQAIVQRYERLLDERDERIRRLESSDASESGGLKRRVRAGLWDMLR